MRRYLQLFQLKLVADWCELLMSIRAVNKISHKFQKIKYILSCTRIDKFLHENCSKQNKSYFVKKIGTEKFTYKIKCQKNS